MNKRSSSKTSRTDWSRVRALSDRNIVVSTDHPEAALKHVVRGIARRGLKPVPAKTSISLRVDADVLEWLKAQGPGCEAGRVTVPGKPSDELAPGTLSSIRKQAGLKQ